MKKKILITALFTALFALASAYLSSDSLEEKTVEKELNYKMESNSKLTVENISGTIAIESWNKNEIRIKYRIVAKGDDEEEAADNLKRINVKVRKSGNEVEVRVEYEKGGFLGFGGDNIRGYVNFDINVPTDCRINASNVSGDNKILNMDSEITSSTVSGDNAVKNSKGNLKISTVSGDTLVQEHSGRISANVVSGDALINNSEGSVVVQGVSGDIAFENVRFSSLSGETVSGDIKIKGSIKEKAEIDLEAVSGDITINLFKIEAPIDYSLSSFSGDINVEPAKGILKIKKRKIEGLISGPSDMGKIILKASTLSGDINLNYK